MNEIIKLNGFEVNQIGGGYQGFLGEDNYTCEIIVQGISIGMGMFLGFNYPSFPGFSFKGIDKIAIYLPKMAGVNIVNSFMVYDPAYQLANDACNWVVDSF